MIGGQATKECTMSVADRVHSLIASLLTSVLFLSSYTPLLVILVILLWPTGRVWCELPLLSIGFELPLWSTALVIVLAFSLFFLWLFVHSLKKSAPKRIEVQEIHRRDEQIVSYLVTYVLPFLAAPFESTEKAIGLGIFFGVVWLLQVKLNLLYINPVLALFNYRLYEVTTSGTVQMLLSKKRRGPTGILYAVTVGDNILFEGER